MTVPTHLEPRAPEIQADVVRSAHAIERSAETEATSADRTTQLAADRTVLAAERTYAAWVRTGFAALAAGVGARALLKETVPTWLALTAALTLIAFSAFCFVAAVWREMTPRYNQPEPDTRRLPAPVLLLVNGVLILVTIAAFVGMLMAR